MSEIFFLLKVQQNHQRNFFQNQNVNNEIVGNNYNTLMDHVMDKSNEVTSSSNAIRIQHHNYNNYNHHHHHTSQRHNHINSILNRSINNHDTLLATDNIQISSKIEPVSYDEYFPQNTNNHTENDSLRSNKVRLIESNNHSIELSDNSSDSDDEEWPQINLPTESSNNSYSTKSTKPTKVRKERTQWTETGLTFFNLLPTKIYNKKNSNRNFNIGLSCGESWS